MKRLYADAAMRLPKSDAKWCALFPRGQWVHHTGGEIEFTDELAAAFVESWKAAGSPPLPITLHHVPDDVDVIDKRTAGEAEGWIEDLRVGEGEVALEGAVKWTDPAKALIAADRYRYLSPEWAMAHIDRRSGEKRDAPWLYGAALLNDPFFHSMPRVAASSAVSTHAPTPTAPKAKDISMNKRICAALRLPEESTEDEIMAAIEKMMTEKAEASKATEETALKLEASLKAASKVDALEKTVASLKADNDARIAELEKLKAAKLDGEIEGLIDGAQREGVAVNDEFRKVLVATAKTAGVDTLKSLLAHQPRGKAPGTERGVAGTNAVDTVEKATAILEASAAKFREAGVLPSDARIRAMEANPEAALLVYRRTNKEA